MKLLIDFAILKITRKLLRAILTTLPKELYMFYLNFEIFISNSL